LPNRDLRQAAAASGCHSDDATQKRTEHALQLLELRQLPSEDLLCHVPIDNAGPVQHHIEQQSSRSPVTRRPQIGFTQATLSK